MEKMPDGTRETLEAIANPIAFIQNKAEKEGSKIDGMMLINLVNNPSYYQELAKDILKKIK